MSYLILFAYSSRSSTSSAFLYFILLWGRRLDIYKRKQLFRMWHHLFCLYGKSTSCCCALSNKKKKHRKISKNRFWHNFYFFTIFWLAFRIIFFFFIYLFVLLSFVLVYNTLLSKIYIYEKSIKGFMFSITSI